MATNTELVRRINDLERELAELKRDMVPHPVREPAGGTGEKPRYGVVRDIGDGANDFVRVQMLKQTIASPGWAFPEVGGSQVAAIEQACYPGLSSAEYALFLSSASGAWSTSFAGMVIPVMPGELSRVAWPWSPMVTIDPALLAAVMQTDCVPPT